MKKRGALAWLMFAVALCLAAPTANADARSAYLIRLLRTSSTFRVRTQAALSLGRIEGDSDAVQALSVALRDEHAAVRTAAASSLERLREPEALTALRAVRRDRDHGVRNAVGRAIRALESVARTRPRTISVPESGTTTPGGPARYYVGVGVPGSSASGMSRSALEDVRSFIRGRVEQMDGVELAAESETTAQARRILSSRRLIGYYIDSSIVRIEERNGGTRAVVSVIVNTYPGRDMRAILQGAVTVSGGGQGAAVQRQAIEGAINVALRRLPEALQASDARSDGK